MFPNGFFKRKPNYAVDGALFPAKDVPYLMMAAEEINLDEQDALYHIVELTAADDPRGLDIPPQKAHLTILGSWALLPKADISGLLDRSDQIKKDLAEFEQRSDGLYLY